MWKSVEKINLTVFQQYMNGLTGLIKFDTNGFRSDFLIDVIELNPGGLIKIGDWSLAKGYREQRTNLEDLIITEEDEFKLHGKHFTVIISIVANAKFEYSIKSTK